MPCSAGVSGMRSFPNTAASVPLALSVLLLECCENWSCQRCLFSTRNATGGQCLISSIAYSRNQSLISTYQADLLDSVWVRLKLDPGARTLGELLQEREWAVNEIERLRAEASHAVWKNGSQKSPDPLRKAEGQMPAGGALTPPRLLRLSEVCQLVGLSRSSIYQLKSQRRFSESLRVGLRNVRWRMVDVLAWQAGVEARGRST